MDDALESGAPKYLTPEEVADRLGLTVGSLRVLRQRGGGPTFHKVGRRVRYLETELAEYMRQRGFDTTEEVAGNG